ncbi:MAG TPA: hypothetical protein VG899_10175 [Mycobacteriales bacterium]|nr:hypothetical protein [Mycobacteriales bacterium]
MSDDLGPDLDFDSLLRGRGDELAPPPGAWEAIRRRGRRRRRMKSALAGAVSLVVVGAAAPALVSLHKSSSDQKLQVAAARQSDTPDSLDGGEGDLVVHPALSLLVPASVSFVTQSEGWVTGGLEVPGGTVVGGLARTTDGGTTWSIETPRPAPQGTVRFADADQGFSFGADYQSTDDGGLTWHTLPSPGYIADLETAHGVVWALVRSCARCARLRLFQATLTSPQLVRVSSVKPVDSYDATLTLRGHAIYVTGGKDLWATDDDGYSWRHETNPCLGESQAFAAWSQNGLAAECTPVRGIGSLFESVDSGRHWTNIANLPHVRAAVGTLSAGTADDLLVTTGLGAPYLTYVHGHRWTRADVPGIVTFAAYISPSHIVGVTSDTSPAFVTSYDSGRTWSEVPYR